MCILLFVPVNLIFHSPIYSIRVGLMQTGLVVYQWALPRFPPFAQAYRCGRMKAARCEVNSSIK